MRVSALVLLSLLGSTVAWWGNGHMLVAEIARQELDASKMEKIESLLSIYDAYFLKGYAAASTWEDDLKDGEQRSRAGDWSA
mmetsp:Transcript_23011/g.58354  ORF Transcript_23011/g.58354 Transcript_23011/m.58354 type:complete len:82 (-) Transcript_23011:1333-1578(-)